MHSLPQHAKLITIDWVDGVGKTTLAERLAECISGVYYKTAGKMSKEEKIHINGPNISAQERFNFYLNVTKKDLQDISKLLRQWKSVVCDRFTESTIVHHLAMDENIDTREAESLNSYPETIRILLVATRKTITERLSDREELTLFEKDMDLMMKTQELYLERTFDLVINTTKHSTEQTLLKTVSFLK